MTDLELVRHLSSLGVRLWVEGDALKFSAPRGVLTDALKEQLRARKGAIVDFLKRASREKSDAIQAIARDGEIPLSFAQERLWFLSRLDPDDPSYTVPLAVRFGGALDVGALEKALSEIARRHEVLRTTIGVSGDRPVAVIHDAEPVLLPVTSLASLPAAELDAAVRREINAEVTRPFDLAKGPLLRARLLARGDQDHVLVLTMHHIVTDGWSNGLLAREIRVLYDAFSAGRPSPLSDLAVQYADYAAWQRARLHGDVLDRQLAYWKRELSGAPPALDLPSDRPRPPVRSYRGATRAVSVPAEVSSALADLARAEGATLFMVLLAAFDVLAHRYTGQDDIVVGSPVAGRVRPEIEDNIGFFVNTLVLRTRIDEGLDFRALLGRVRATCLGAYAHQDISFERIVQEIAPARDRSRSPIFQVLVSMANAPAERVSLPGLAQRGVGVDPGTSKFDLTLAMGDGPQGLRVVMEFATDLFDAPTIDRMLGHYRTLLEGIAKDPGAPVGRLPILGDAERRVLLLENNATHHEHPTDRLIHEVFAAQASATPDAIALRFEGRDVRYGELDERSSRLARALRARGVGPDVLVGVFCERSVEMLVALYGVLRAGGAYVPLDPEYPRDRLAFMLDDARPRVILTQAHIADLLPEHDAALIRLDGDWETIASEPPDAPPRGDLGLDHLAYVIYTSGSTGRPKGAMNSHRGILNRLLWMQRAYRLTSNDVVLQKTPFSFDVSVWELFWPLMFGARLVIARPGGHRDPSYLAHVIRAEGVTTLHFVPSMLAAFLEAPSAVECRSIVRVIASGEALPPALADRFFARLAHAELHNLYGPTEAAVDVTAWAVRPGDATLPIGKPIDNVRIYILDGRMSPVPIGVPGDLFIAGVQVGRGYLNRPELTAERFVRDPFGELFGDARAMSMYRSGDVARWLPGGAIEYLGRSDFQVKIRGFRIELGEIEAALVEHPGVREAVVIAREEASGDKRLVAYVAAAEPPAPDAAALRAFLAERLPDYMIPSAIVSLPALPLTSSGKVDRRALPEPEARPASALEVVGPRGPIEEMIAGIWSELLKLARISVHDDFFEIGGHSLLATQVGARLAAAFGVELPLSTLFDASTVASLAERIAEAMKTGRGPTAPPIERAPEGAPRVLSFAQERLWFIDQLVPDDPSYVVPLAMRLRGALDAAALDRALTEIVRRHEVLRTTYVAESGKPAPRLHPPPDHMLAAVVGLQHLPDAEREAAARREIAADATRPFNLAEGPMLRARLVELSGEDYLLLVSMHHIVSDAWSGGVLSREITALYEAFSRALPSPLADVPIQYADYAAWQRAWLAGEVFDAQLAYWKDRLAGAPATIDLPTDRPRPAAPSHRGARRSIALPEGLATALRRLSREHGATLFMTLLAGFYALLHRWSGQRDLVVGTPIAGRTRAETEGIIGFFINTLALRAEIEEGATFADLIASVRSTCLGAYAHQDMPFERLVQEIEPDRDLGRSPIFQVVFVLQNAPAESIKLAGLDRRGVAADTTAAKFDLTFVLVETPRGIGGSIEYATDLFDAPTIARMAAHFGVLLEGAAKAPDKRIWELPILPEDELRRVVEFCTTRTEYPRDATIHALFEAQAARTPDAVAVTFGGASLTYAALNQRANQLAHRLREKGVGADAPVGLFARRSIEMIVATIAILKAGGAYVPLDPELPDARLAWIVADAGVGLVVAAGAVARPGAIGEAELIDLAAEADRFAAESDRDPAPLGTAESLAYVMYTSGSTGTPKGVCVVHRGVVRLVKNTTFAPFDATEVFLQLAPIAFDASTLEIWGPLLNGGRLVIAPPDPPSLAEIGDLVRAGGVTTLWLTAGLFNAMIDGSPEGLRTLRRLIAGGEALSLPHVQKARRELAGVTLINGYGPTENTTFTACHTITDADLAGPIPIGRPIANTTVHILDDHRNPTPIGVPGELYTGGDGLARGYLGRPDLTAERFVADPFGDDEHARVYRTGDRARWLPNGTIEFLGRFDFQVKLRGFRIELGEIEAAIAAHPSVSAAVVLLREDTPGDKRLVAYVASDVPIPPADLRALLADRLPAYMVPSAFVALAALPLTPNGKVDRRALPAPEVDGAIDRERVLPRGPIEAAIASIFSEVLKIPIDQVGAHDGFFGLGGHSLLATQVISRTRAVLGIDLPLRAIFEAPTPAELAVRIEAARMAGGAAVAPPMVRVPRGPAMPLSFAQERLWFIHQLDPADPSYVVPYPVRLEGPIDLGAIERAITEIVRRHEVLRTTYAVADGKPVAVIHDAAPMPVPVRSFAALPEADREPALVRAIAEEAAKSFDLAAGPVIRAVIFALGPEDHVLCLAMHHIATDGWSIGVLAREIGALYDAFSRGVSSPLADLPIQYADFASWQRAFLAGGVLTAGLDRSTRRLAGAPRALDLPTDRPRPPAPSRRGAMRPFALDAAASAAIRDLARREGATVFMVLLAALDVLLHRFSGQTDITVGTPIAGRTRAETEGLVGCFVNTLVMRAEIDPHATFRDLIRRVREDALDAFTCQDTPFEALVAALDPDRDLSRSPLFQVMFVLQTAPMGAPRIGSAKRRTAVTDNVTAKFDLTLTLMDREDGIAGAMEFATDLFDPDTIDRLLASYRTLLVSIADRADARVWELPILSVDEERRLIGAAGGSKSFPVTACLHDLFEASAEMAPSAIAATCDGAGITYRDLDARSNQLARALQKRGVGPDVLVGLCLERSIDMLVGLLGILKAGGAYLPLDPEYPKDRLAFMIDDARVPVVITEARHASTLAGASLLQLDADRDAIAGESADRVESGARPESLAYVIYTSGSTGKPKGVMVEHRNVVRLFTATEAWFGFGDRDVWTMFHSYAFDFSVWEIWGALLYGGRVVIVPYWVSRSPETFYALSAREGVTVLSQTPSAFRQFVHADGLAPEALRAERALRYVIFGGEALDIGDLAPFWDRHGDERPRLVNMYGITETTVHVTYRPVSRADLAKPWSSVIGEGIRDLSVHILDAHKRPAPIGVPGEMYVGGAGVARGYLNRPELTTERFLADPFRPGGRLYKTGDLARRLANGDIEYLGRIDHQVKIRGFRIELGEIEAALDQHPGVREAVVIAREDQPGDKRLVGYLVPGPVPPRVADLKSFLRERLPDYMVPAAFVTMDALPLTSNGKIDRRALPAPEAPGISAHAYVAPRGPIEEAIAGIFAEVLRAPRVGARDGFFELGGHSLSAVQAMARVRDALGVDLPLRAIFEAPAPADLAARVEAATLAGGAPVPPPITRVPRGAPIDLSFGQERLWVLDQIAPGDPTYTVPLTFRFSGPLDAGALDRAIRALVERHEVLRTTFTSEHGQPRQVIHDRADVRLPVEDLRALPEPDRDRVARGAARAEALRPFDLAAGPVLRARLFVLADDAHLLSLVVHHIAIDEWSTAILLREIPALYEAAREGRPPALADLPIQYADYASWQRGWLTGEVAGGQLAYWRAALAGAPASLDLPTDRPRPPVQSHRGATTVFAVPATLAARLGDIARREGATLFMTLLAAFDLFLHRHTGQDDLTVGTPIANRARVETEGLVGFFLNTLVLRSRVDLGIGFSALVARVKETCLGAYAHQDMPFEKLVKELDPDRDLSRSPLFQALFTWNAPAEAPRAEGSSSLRIRGGITEGATAKFDLSLSLGERPTGALGGSFEYATDLFDAATIDRFIARFLALLAGIAADPEARLSDLPLMPASERDVVLHAWNATDHAYPDDALIHEVFAAQAARTPDAVAVRFEGAEITYRDLDERSNRLAHALRRRGVGPGSLVGVCLERSFEMVIALYGVLKAGGAYVPLDPDYPRDRLAFMLGDANPAVILTASHVADVLPETGAALLQLDTEWGAVASEPASCPPREGVDRESLAYVIYTSGSTGKPKGAMNAHRGILNRLLWMQDAYRLTSNDRVLQKTPFSFDVSVWEFFWPLMFGARLVVARPGGHREPGYLAQLIEAEGVTTLHFVPSMLSVFLDEIEARPMSDATHLRRVLCSGEALPPALAGRFFTALRAVELHNLYGPTEAAVDVTACRVEPGAAVVTIGRPIHNVRIYLLDDCRQPVPIGVRGELYIAGVQVGRGYLNRPELTADRFVRDPFGDLFGDERATKMYRTGDVARWLPDGSIEYLGRADFQVKIRGFRIELGEIEATLLAHPSVRDVVVVARDDRPGAPRLVAYLVAAEGGAPTVADLRAFLLRSLPDYMVPAAFVVLPSLPLTASGKVDRRALPAPDEGPSADLGEAFVAPEGPIEEALAQIWSAVLRRDRVGARDNFFAVGGDSILAIQIVARAQAAGIRITPRQIFQEPTIAGLAAVAGTGRAVITEEGPIAGPVIASPIQAWWLSLDLADPHHYNQALFFERAARLDAAIVERAILAILDHHDALRIRVERGPDGARLAIVPAGDPAPLRRVDLADVPERERRPAIEKLAAEAQASLDLVAGPLVRVVLFDLGADVPCRLLFVVHHLAIDGVSWRALLEDFWTAYAQIEAHRPVALPPKTTSFRQWTERLASHARSSSIEAEAAYWLAGSRARVPRVPVDFTSGSDVEATAKTVVVHLSTGDTEDLLTRVPEVYRTQINDVLLTALTQAIGRWAASEAADRLGFASAGADRLGFASAGADRLGFASAGADRLGFASAGADLVALVDLEGHGREELWDDVDLTRTVGWFTTLFPVMLEIRANAGPGEALTSVKEQLRAIPGRGLGYGLLRFLDPGSPVAVDLAKMPPAEVSFNYLGQFDQAVPDDAGVRRARESAGPAHSPRARRPHLVDVTASVADRRLGAQWTYLETRHRRETIEALAEAWIDALRAIIAHCLSPEAGGATPSDFEKASLSQDAIDMLAALDSNAEASSE